MTAEQSLLEKSWIRRNPVTQRPEACRIVFVKDIGNGKKVIMVQKGESYETHDNFTRPYPER